MAYVRESVEANILTLSSLFDLGVGENETASFFAGEPPTVLLAALGYHELLIDTKFLVEIESFDSIDLVKKHTALVQGNSELYQEHVTYLAVKNKDGVAIGSSLTNKRLELRAGTKIEIPQGLVVFSFNYLGYSSLPNPNG